MRKQTEIIFPNCIDYEVFADEEPITQTGKTFVVSTILEKSITFSPRYETMIFPQKSYQQVFIGDVPSKIHYTSKTEAQNGHQRIVEQLSKLQSGSSARNYQPR